MLRRLIRGPAVQAALASLLGLYLATVIRTTRWSVVGLEHAVPFMQDGRRPLVLAFWHERLPLMPAVFLEARRRFPRTGIVAHVLVSRHRDGRLIGGVVGRFGMDLVYASSSRGGTSGIIELLRVLRRGEIVAITPDGPRGPRRVAAPGVATLAALSGAPVLPSAAATTRRRIMARSWDRMMLPLPFGRAVIVIGPPIAVPRDGAEAALPRIEAALSACCDAADAHVAARRVA